MNDKDLHTLLSDLKGGQLNLPHNKAHTRALLMHEHERQQSSRKPLGHQSLIAFIKRVIEGKNMKLSFASPLAVTLGIVILTGTAGAAAFWFNAQVTSSANGNIISVNIKNCPTIPASQAKAVGTTLPAIYTFDEKYHIIDNSQIGRSQIEQAARAMCEQRAIAAGINSTFPDMQEFSASNLAPNSKGLYFPIYLSGTVASIEGNTITFEKLESNSAHTRTATMQLAKDALLTKAGDTITSLQPGDIVYFAYQNEAVTGETPNQYDAASLNKTTDPGYHSVIRGIGVMTTDASAIQKLRDALGSGAVEILQSDPLQG